jgi:hypothetical protein
MSDSRQSIPRRWPWLLLAAGALAATGGIAYAVLRSDPTTPPLPPEPAEATAGQVNRMCVACHALAPPEIFPRSEWRRKVARVDGLLPADPS